MCRFLEDRENKMPMKSVWRIRRKVHIMLVINIRKGFQKEGDYKRISCGREMKTC